MRLSPVARIVAVTGVAMAYGMAQTHSGFPVDISAGPPPQLVTVNGRSRLVYELHLTNVAPIPIGLVTLEVFGDDGTTPIASYRGEALDKLLVMAENLLLPEPVKAPGKPISIAEGHAAIIFLDLALDPGTRAPTELRHRLTFSIPRNAALNRTVNNPVIPVVQEPVPVLRAPLSGSSWVAFNALATYDHRRAFQTVDGKLLLAQRFAIDWMRLGPDGRLFHDDTKSNANFYGYGAEVLAVADGNVADMKDGLPDNAGSSERSSRVITPDNALGNYITLDLGNRRFAVYAHLQGGSLKVKLGDAVKAGQGLARLGNSGNSDAPHLHFQLIDANSPLGAEGIPYELETFTQLGVIDDEEALFDKGQAWQQKTGEQPVAHRKEFPANNAVVMLP